MIANFHVTAMCDDCQNALVGIVRQGFVCQRKSTLARRFDRPRVSFGALGCKLICHPDCMEKISTPCRPSIKDRSKQVPSSLCPHPSECLSFSGRTILLDQHIVRVSSIRLMNSVALFPLSLSLEQIPKAGGIKKGWSKYQLLNLQTKLLFYELSSDKDQKITWPQPAFIIDLTDDEFTISSVTSSDAYHANKKDVSSILKVSDDGASCLSFDERISRLSRLVF